MSRAKSCCQWISFRYKSGGCRMTFPGWGRGTPRWVNWVSWFACASIRSEPMATAIASLNPYSVFISARSGFLSKKEDDYLVRYRRTNRMLATRHLYPFFLMNEKIWNAMENLHFSQKAISFRGTEEELLGVKDLFVGRCRWLRSCWRGLSFRTSPNGWARLTHFGKGN